MNKEEDKLYHKSRGMTIDIIHQLCLEDTDFDSVSSGILDLVDEIQQNYDKSLKEKEKKQDKKQIRELMKKYHGRIDVWHKKLTPSENYAFEYLEQIDWNPQRVKGGKGLPDFICTGGKWVEVKLSRRNQPSEIDLSVRQLKKWDELIKDGQKIFLLIVCINKQKYKLFKIKEFKFEIEENQKVGHKARGKGGNIAL